MLRAKKPYSATRTRSLESLPLATDHPDNRPFMDALRLVPTLQRVPSAGAAFADFRDARRRSGSYTAFFAYRVLEDLAYTFGGAQPDRRRNLDAMNGALGTSKAHWDPAD